jgi:hypothetical protein
VTAAMRQPIASCPDRSPRFAGMRRCRLLTT